MVSSSSHLKYESFSSLRSTTVDAPFFFFVLLIDGPSFVDGAWRSVLSSNLQSP
jgi:hypothetical protein